MPDHLTCNNDDEGDFDILAEDERYNLVYSEVPEIPPEERYPIGEKILKRDDTGWCSGRIEAYRCGVRLYFVKYDDGDEEEFLHDDIHPYVLQARRWNRTCQRKRKLADFKHQDISASERDVSSSPDKESRQQLKATVGSGVTKPKRLFDLSEPSREDCTSSKTDPHFKSDDDDSEQHHPHTAPINTFPAPSTPRKDQTQNKVNSPTTPELASSPPTSRSAAPKQETTHISETDDDFISTDYPIIPADERFPIGQEILKSFNAGWFRGWIKDYRFGGRLYHVVYSDNDEEEFTHEEILPFIVHDADGSSEDWKEQGAQVAEKPKKRSIRKARKKITEKNLRQRSLFSFLPKSDPSAARPMKQKSISSFKDKSSDDEHDSSSDHTEDSDEEYLPAIPLRKRGGNKTAEHDDRKQSSMDHFVVEIF